MEYKGWVLRLSDEMIHDFKLRNVSYIEIIEEFKVWVDKWTS